LSTNQIPDFEPTSQSETMTSTARTPDSDLTSHGIVQSTAVYPKSDFDLPKNQEDATTSSGIVQGPRYNFKRTLFGYVKTKQFWLVLFFGYAHYYKFES
jgi:hypothetical protein